MQISNNIFLLIKIIKLSTYSFSQYFKNLFNIFPDKNYANKIIIDKKINKKDEFTEYESNINKKLEPINNDTLKSSMNQIKPKNYTVQILKNQSNDVINEICETLQKERYEINSKMVLDRNDISYIMNKLNNYSLLNKIVMIRKRKK